MSDGAVIAVCIIAGFVGFVLLYTICYHLIHGDEWEASQCPWPWRCYMRDGDR